MRGAVLGMNHGWLNAKIPDQQPKPARLDVQRGYSMNDRIGAIFQAVTMSLMDPQTRKVACDAVRPCEARDDQCEVHGIAKYIRENVTYRGEIPGFDVFQTLGRSLELKAGDCDCMSIAGLALYSQIGYSVGVRIVMFNTSDGHAYTVLKLPRLTAGSQSVVPLDLSEMDAPAGWEVERNQTISAVDYWYSPVQWIAWYKRGADRRSAPVPQPVPAT